MEGGDFSRAAAARLCSSTDAEDLTCGLLENQCRKDMFGVLVMKLHFPSRRGAKSVSNPHKSGTLLFGG
jgi:hypothetical protein